MTPKAPFAFSVPTAVRFGDGVSAQLADVLPSGPTGVVFVRGKRGVAAALLLSDLRKRGVEVYEVTCAAEPSVPSVNAALEQLEGLQVAAVVACGGGAVIDSGKAITFCLNNALRLSDDFAQIAPGLLDAAGPIPCIAIPTTAGTGAEVTANAVLDVPSRQAKISLRGRALFPTTALVDPLLLPSAPRTTVLSSGLDAVVQTIESYTSNAATPFSDAFTAPNVGSGLRALRAVMKTNAPDAWRTLAWVSLSSGLALANSGLGAAHGLASVLGGRYGAAHGALCGRFLLPVLRRNLHVAPQGSEAASRLARCCAAIAEVFPPASPTDQLSGLETWVDAQGLPRLAAMGVEQAAFADLSTQSSQASSSKKNAVELSEADFTAILHKAY